jgi:acyl-coenzyme A synthetase/AMP-(fatty) acid ligase
VEAIDRWLEVLSARQVRPGEVVALISDFEPAGVGLLLALAENRNVIVPLLAPLAESGTSLIEVAQAEHCFEVTAESTYRCWQPPAPSGHVLLEQLRTRREAGLVLFSSGTAGDRKASLLSFDRLSGRYSSDKASLRTLGFLLPDHIGGLNTLLAVLSAGGTLVRPPGRAPEAVCRTIEEQRVELLPTTPTFLTLMLIDEAHRRFDLSSLRIITYGTEPMPEATLQALRRALPHVKLKQTYGLTETGILPTRSRASDSRWLQIGGDGFEVRVLAGELLVRAPTAMLGYLNAPSPFDKDGWLNTHDQVEQDGDYYRILGRTTEIINVGGEKVYPAQVENVLLRVDNIQDAKVTAKRNPITGQVVVATVRLVNPEAESEVRRRVQTFCRRHLAAHQVPVLVFVTNRPLHGERFKKARAPEMPS